MFRKIYWISGPVKFKVHWPLLAQQGKKVPLGQWASANVKPWLRSSCLERSYCLSLEKVIMFVTQKVSHVSHAKMSFLSVKNVNLFIKMIILLFTQKSHSVCHPKVTLCVTQKGQPIYHSKLSCLSLKKAILFVIPKGHSVCHSESQYIIYVSFKKVNLFVTWKDQPVCHSKKPSTQKGNSWPEWPATCFNWPHSCFV